MTVRGKPRTNLASLDTIFDKLVTEGEVTLLYLTEEQIERLRSTLAVKLYRTGQKFNEMGLTLDAANRRLTVICTGATETSEARITFKLVDRPAPIMFTIIDGNQDAPV